MLPVNNHSWVGNPRLLVLVASGFLIATRRRTAVGPGVSYYSVAVMSLGVELPSTFDSHSEQESYFTFNDFDEDECRLMSLVLRLL